jgi:hypothetical protein
VDQQRGVSHAAFIRSDATGTNARSAWRPKPQLIDGLAADDKTARVASFHRKIAEALMNRAEIYGVEDRPAHVRSSVMADNEQTGRRATS